MDNYSERREKRACPLPWLTTEAERKIREGQLQAGRRTGDKTA